MHTAPIKYLMTRKGDLVVSSAIQPKTRPNDRSMSSRQSNALKKKQKKTLGLDGGQLVCKILAKGARVACDRSIFEAGAWENDELTLHAAF